MALMQELCHHGNGLACYESSKVMILEAIFAAMNIT